MNRKQSGIFFVALGFILNTWFLAGVFSEDSVIESKNFYNMTNVFLNKTEPIFIDFTHITGDGNKIIAEKIYSILSD